MRFMDFDPVSRSPTGLDRRFTPLETMPRLGQDIARITMAVAGLAPAELTVTTQAAQRVLARKKVSHPRRIGISHSNQPIQGRVAA